MSFHNSNTEQGLISNPSIKKVKKNRGKRPPRRKPRPERGAVYLSHLPHGFYKDQVKAYCRQFGKVTGLYFPRNKNGNYRGFGFVEFENPEVAKIVADTMNNYLMYDKLLKVEYIPPSRQRPGVIRRSKYHDNHVQQKAIQQTERTLHNMTRILTPKEEIVQRKQINSSIKYYHKKLKKMGVDYEFQVEK